MQNINAAPSITKNGANPARLVWSVVAAFHRKETEHTHLNNLLQGLHDAKPQTTELLQKGKG